MILDGAGRRKFPGRPEKLFQFFPRPADPAFDRAGRDGEKPGGLLAGQALQLRQNQGVPLLLRQGGDGRPEPGVLIAAEGLALGPGLRIGRVKALLRQRLQGKMRAPLLPTQEIEAAVSRDAVRPGFEGAVRPEGIQAAPQPEHGLLHAVGGVLPIAGIMPADTPDQGLQAPDQRFKSLRISGPGSLQQQLIHGRDPPLQMQNRLCLFAVFRCCLLYWPAPLNSSGRDGERPGAGREAAAALRKKKRAPEGTEGKQGRFFPREQQTVACAGSLRGL